MVGPPAPLDGQCLETNATKSVYPYFLPEQNVFHFIGVSTIIYFTTQLLAMKDLNVENFQREIPIFGDEYSNVKHDQHLATKDSNVKKVFSEIPTCATFKHSNFKSK